MIEYIKNHACDKCKMEDINKNNILKKLCFPCKEKVFSYFQNQSDDRFYDNLRTLKSNDTFLMSDHSPLMLILQHDIKIISWNILAFVKSYFSYYDEETTNFGLSSERRIAIIKYLKNLDADFYCLQEVDEITAVVFASEFDEYNTHYEKHPKKENGLMIMGKLKLNSINYINLGS